MEIFEKISKAASKTYKATTEKTAKIAKETKLKMSVNDYKKEIAKKYREIGEMVYQKSVVGEEVEKEMLNEKCEEIDALAKQIVDWKNEILTINAKKTCPNCYDEIEIIAAYCPACGFKQEKINDEEEDKTERNECECEECNCEENSSDEE